MSWATRYRMRGYFRGSAWLMPAAMIPVAILAGWVVRRIDDATRWEGLGYTAESARSLLNAIAPATLTFIVLILSTLLLTVQLAASQLSPRLIGGLLSWRSVKVCLSIFVFAYVYCAAALGRIDERVPQLPIVIAIGATLLAVGTGLYFVDYMAKELRPVRMLARTAAIGRDVIEHVYPAYASGKPPETPPAKRAMLPEPSETIVRVGRSGVFMAMDVDGLRAAARAAGGAVEVIPQVGDFVARGEPLFRLHPGHAAFDVARLRTSVVFGNERTAEQDPTFVFRILVDVACKALSPAINDPTTAVLAIDQIHPLLRQVGIRRLDTGEVRDAGGQLRVLYRTPDWDDFVLLAVSEIRHYGADSLQVARRLHAMLEQLLAGLPPERAPALEEQLRLLQSGVARHFDDPEDRLRAETNDLQGVGSSRNGKPRASA